MGYIINRFVIVSGWKDEHLERARDKALSLFDKRLVTPLMMHLVNQSHSFFINSSGSKSGWIDAKEHDENIEAFIEWCKKENLYNDILIINAPEELEKTTVETISYKETP